MSTSHDDVNVLVLGMSQTEDSKLLDNDARTAGKTTAPMGVSFDL